MSSYNSFLLHSGSETVKKIPRTQNTLKRVKEFQTAFSPLTLYMNKFPPQSVYRADDGNRGRYRVSVVGAKDLIVKDPTMLLTGLGLFFRSHLGNVEDGADFVGTLSHELAGNLEACQVEEGLCLIGCEGEEERGSRGSSWHMRAKYERCRDNI